MYRYKELALSIIGIFLLTLIGAIFSPTFEEQNGFLELFMVMGSLVFIFSVLVVLATIGFSSFALYIAVFVAIVMAMFGVLGGFLVVAMTYVLWGFVFGIEVLLVGHNVESAKEWFRSRYTFESFILEYRVFYLMIMIVYLLVEILPWFLGQEKPKRFTPSQIIEEMREVLSK